MYMAWAEVSAVRENHKLTLYIRIDLCQPYPIGLFLSNITNFNV